MEEQRSWKSLCADELHELNERLSEVEKAIIEIRKLEVDAVYKDFDIDQRRPNNLNCLRGRLESLRYKDPSDVRTDVGHFYFSEHARERIDERNIIVTPANMLRFLHDFKVTFANGASTLFKNKYRFAAYLWVPTGDTIFVCEKALSGKIVIKTAYRAKDAGWKNQVSWESLRSSEEWLAFRS